MGKSCLSLWILWIILGITIISYALGFIGNLQEGFETPKTPTQKANEKLDELNLTIQKYLNLVTPGTDTSEAIQLQQTIVADKGLSLDSRRLLASQIQDNLYKYSNEISRLTRKDTTNLLGDLKNAIQYFLDLAKNSPQYADATDNGKKLLIRVESQLNKKTDSNDPTYLTSSQIIRQIQKFQGLASEVLDSIDQKSLRARKVAIQSYNPFSDTEKPTEYATITENDLYGSEKELKEDIDPAEVLAIDESPQPAGAAYDAAFFTPIWGVGDRGM